LQELFTANLAEAQMSEVC